MATDLLVKPRIDDGRTFIDLLSSKRFDVTVAAWVQTSEEGIWFLYVASTCVETKGLSLAYREAFGIHSTIEGTTISALEIKLIGANNPIAIELLSVREQFSEKFVGPPRVSRIGTVSVESVYVYDKSRPLRQAFRVHYFRDGASNRWRATIERGKFYWDIRASGAVAYSAGAQWGGAGDDNFAIVSVLVEVDPRFADESNTMAPGDWQLLAQQARAMADEMFKAHQPDAEIVHVGNGA
jgi:hypothetical protein